MKDLRVRLAYILNVIYKSGNIGVLVLPFLLMDLYIRVLSTEISYSRAEMYFPSVMFSVIWISAIVLMCLFFGSKAGRILYFSLFLLFFAFFVTHTVYFKYTGFFFNFNLLESAD